MVRRAIVHRVLLALVAPCILVAPCTAAGQAHIAIRSDPAGLDTWANERYLGRTPTAGDLPGGQTILRLARPSDSLYSAPVADTLLNLTEGETLAVRLSVGHIVSVRSQPFGLPLLHDGERVGRTPLELRIDARRTGTWKLLTPRGPIHVPTDTLLARGSWTWKGAPFPAAGAGGRSRPLLRRLGRYMMPALAVSMVAAGVITEDAADRSYGRYLRTAEPREIRRRYDEARRRDAWAAAFWISAEASLASAILSWILPEGEGGGYEGRVK